MDVAKPYEFKWFGDIHGPKPYKVHEVSMGVYFADTGKAQMQPTWGRHSRTPKLGDQDPTASCAGKRSNPTCLASRASPL